MSAHWQCQQRQHTAQTELPRQCRAMMVCPAVRQVTMSACLPADIGSNRAQTPDHIAPLACQVLATLPVGSPARMNCSQQPSPASASTRSANQEWMYCRSPMALATSHAEPTIAGALYQRALRLAALAAALAAACLPPSPVDRLS